LDLKSLLLSGRRVREREFKAGGEGKRLMGGKGNGGGKEREAGEGVD